MVAEDRRVGASQGSFSRANRQVAESRLAASFLLVGARLWTQQADDLTLGLRNPNQSIVQWLLPAVLQSQTGNHSEP